MAPFTFKGEATSEYTENLASESVTLQIRASMGFTFTTPGSGFTISPGPPDLASLQVGTDGVCSPRHSMRFNSRNEGSKCVG